MSKADPPSEPRSGTDGERPLSRASVGRFSLYLRHLEQFHSAGTKTISSSQLGEALGITDAQVRKDLAYLGNLGHPGVGYPTQDVIAALRRKLGIDREWRVVVVGAGNLARALLRYRGFQQQGFRIVALFDADAGKIGQRIDDLEVHSPDTMPAVVAATGAELGLLTVPAEVAQGVADTLVAAGIRGVLNFAPIVLRLPPHVSLVSVDLTVQLEQLAFLVQLGGNE
ncbi:MAG TPA: redox-sensing transcriptional repressor Rex [Gemmataceae bacterium]|nr:redox-sensing transcriptional repressor Rex [Gemmataceae bacterium]